MNQAMTEEEILKFPAMIDDKLMERVSRRSS